MIEAHLTLGGVELSIGEEDDQIGSFERSYGSIVRKHETNALRLDEDHYFVPINKWHYYHGNERREFYKYACEDLEKAKDFWIKQSLYYVTTQVKVTIFIRVKDETMLTHLYASMGGVENDPREIVIYFRELLLSMRTKLSYLGFSMLELDAAFEKYAKLSDKELQWEVT